MPLVPTAATSAPMVPPKPDAWIAGEGLTTSPIRTTTSLTNTALPLNPAKAPVKVTVLVVVPQLKLLMLTPSTVIDRQSTDALMVYSAGKVTVKVSVLLTWLV